MTNDTLSAQMAEALRVANTERSEPELTAKELDEILAGAETAFIQEEPAEDRATVQV